MSEKKNWGSTVLGWFVVKEGEGGGDLPAEPETLPPEGGPAASAVVEGPPPVAFVTEPPRAVGGQVDFDGVFEAAGVDVGERDLFAKAQALLGSLPPGTDPAVRKQIVEASLKAFGVPIEKIIETGVEEIQALEAYIRTGGVETQALLEESNRRIQQHEDEIRSIRAVMDQRVQEQQAVTTACNAKKLDVQRVLEFFGQEAVARVVRESPKLHDPSASPPSGT
jgi:hypothetical protein